MNLHRASKNPDWADTPTAERNIWQRLAARTSGMVTLANGITIFGFILVLVGLVFLTRQRPILGIVFILVGRCLDMLDGVVADATKTKSSTGEFLDALVDKVLLGVVLVFVCFMGGVPGVLIGFTALSALLTTSIAYWARRQGREVHPTRVGKIATALIWISLLCFIAVPFGAWLYQVGVLLGIAGIILSFAASWQYFRQARSSK